MAKKVFSKAEKRSWLNGLKLGYTKCGKQLPERRSKSSNDSSFDVDEFYERALARTAAMMTKAAPKPAKMRHSKKSTHKQVKKPAKKKPVYDYSEGFDWTPSGRIKGSYVDGKFEPD